MTHKPESYYLQKLIDIPIPPKIGVLDFYRNVRVPKDWEPFFILGDIMEMKIIAISGGFDPVHKGHVQMIEEASKVGPVMVILNSDEWLVRKKGYVFMPWDERAYILGNIKGVHIVAQVDDSDGTVCEALRRMKPDAFANGGDRKETNTPEMEVCDYLDIELLWNVGGEKTQSSSTLVNKARWEQRQIPSGEIK